MSVTLLFPSAISRYLVSNTLKWISLNMSLFLFPSAISRYLVSNMREDVLNQKDIYRFHPLYRGTWFPTGFVYALFNGGCLVSIRYVAVLGF